MKKQPIIALAIAGISVIAFAFGAWRFEQKNQLPTDTGTVEEISLAQLAAHNQPDHCWILVGSRVYNMSSFIAEHPDNTTYVELCGKDATSLLASAPSAASQKQLSVIEPYFIGVIAP